MTESDDNPNRRDTEGRATPPEGRPSPAAAAGCFVTRSSSSPCVIVVDAIAGEKGLLALLQARREYSALERSLERARTENAELREMARRLREDPDAIEEQARRELGLIKPGEILFIVKDIEKK